MYKAFFFFFLVGSDVSINAVKTQIILQLVNTTFMGGRAKIQRNPGLPIMFDYIQLLPRGMEILLMVKQPACVCVVLFIMILRQERKIRPRKAFVAIFCVTQSLETKLRSQVS